MNVENLKETMIYEKLEDKKVKCGICSQECVIPPGGKGFCEVRENIDGKLYSLVYGRPVSIAIDPIEKKPFFHFAPGSRALSIATVGCNLKCKFCQNWEISQEFDDVYGEKYSPQDLVKKAKAWRCGGIAYTYTEPAVFYEYVYDTAKEAQTELYNVLVTNGYMTPEAIKKISPYIDAANVDLKGDYTFYKNYCLGLKGDEPVKRSLLEMKRNKIFVEVTVLLIPGLNDDDSTISIISEWIAKKLGKKTPVHFSRFYPHYKMQDVPPTPVETLERAREIAKDNGLWYVYIGNVPGHKYENTYCHSCGRLLIERHGYEITKFNIDKNLRCIYCGEKIPIEGKHWIPKELFHE
ncbi:MAG: AmmeMemoRadiSam system radical SAM enzyme [Candidatus Aenigmarchaeota archaeon]|nr:AmmeMemoRadiSam system radical SAM enzyme [Candidatus Aenigmarchaeota archaeon]